MASLGTSVTLPASDQSVLFRPLVKIARISLLRAPRSQIKAGSTIPLQLILCSEFSDVIEHLLPHYKFSVCMERKSHDALKGSDMTMSPASNRAENRGEEGNGIHKSSLPWYMTHKVTHKGNHNCNGSDGGHASDPDSPHTSATAIATGNTTDVTEIIEVTASTSATTATTTTDDVTTVSNGKSRIHAIEVHSSESENPNRIDLVLQDKKIKGDVLSCRISVPLTPGFYDIHITCTALHTSSKVFGDIYVMPLSLRDIEVCSFPAPSCGSVLCCFRVHYSWGNPDDNSPIGQGQDNNESNTCEICGNNKEIEENGHSSSASCLKEIVIKEEYGKTLGSHVYDSAVVLVRYLDRQALILKEERVQREIKLKEEQRKERERQEHLLRIQRETEESKLRPHVQEAFSYGVRPMVIMKNATAQEDNQLSSFIPALSVPDFWEGLDIGIFSSTVISRPTSPTPEVSERPISPEMKRVSSNRSITSMNIVTSPPPSPPEYIVPRTSLSTPTSGSESALELGSGCGLVGIRLGATYSRVYLTDKKYQIPLLRENIALNHMESMCQARELEWSSREQMQLYLKECGHPHLIVATDVLYDKDLAEAFFQTLKFIASPDYTQIVVAQKIRPDDRYTSVNMKKIPNFTCVKLLEEASVILWQLWLDSKSESSYN